MLSNQSVTNEKPRDSGGTKFQGNIRTYNNNNSTTFKDNKSRHDKGMEIYKAGRVRLTPSGMFKVSERFYVDTEKMQCDCPDYKTRKESCKHIFAALLFVKNRGKQSIENLEGHSNGAPSKQSANKPQEAHNKDFDKQAVITRLATINSAIEALKTHRKPIEFSDIVSLAAQLEKWALGN